MWPPASRAAAGLQRLTSGVASTAAGWSLGLLATALIVWSPYLESGLRSPQLHLVLDTFDACVALLVAYLVHGRFVRDGRWQDFLLSGGLFMLGLPGLGLNVALQLLPGVQPGTLDVWLPLTLRTAGAVLIVAAALAGPRRMELGSWRRWAWVVPTGLLSVVVALLWLFRTAVPLALPPGYVPGATQPGLDGHLVLRLTQALAAVAFLVSSVAFAHHAARRPDPLLRWLGPACALAGFARIHYLLFPSLYTDWLYTGDLLRTGCYLLLLVGAGRELRQYWTSRAEVAVLEDRRRLARELHDGVIQELAYIRTESYRLPVDLPTGERIIAACDRGLNEARAAVQALGRVAEEPLGWVIHRAARELAERYDVGLEVDVDDSITADPDQQHALLRITREAVSNAVRHGRANRVHVRLSRECGEHRLAICDDGSGFDVEAVAARPGGYGLVSMRDRARTLPGSFEVQAQRGSGSTVTVTW